MASLYISGYAGNFNPNYQTTIANGLSASGVITCQGLVLCGIKIPAAFTGTSISFAMCDTVGGTYVQIKNTLTGVVLAYTVAAGAYYAIDPKDFYGVNFLKIVSNAGEAAARTLVCSLKGI